MAAADYNFAEVVVGAKLVIHHKGLEIALYNAVVDTWVGEDWKPLEQQQKKWLLGELQGWKQTRGHKMVGLHNRPIF